MFRLPQILLMTSLVALGACSQTSTTPSNSMVPERGDPAFLKARSLRGDEVYINPDASKGAEYFRKIYIATADVSRMQIIQPEGVTPHNEWEVTDLEVSNLQSTIEKEYHRALGFESAYNVVDSAEEAEMILRVRVVAVSPFATRDEYQAGSHAGGSITISTSLRNAETGQVMIRAVDTKSTDNIWAFHQVGNEEDAVDLVFRAWGNQVRRGLLQLQGRARDVFYEPAEFKEQDSKPLQP